MRDTGDRVPQHPIDPRVRLAAERTLLAWVRTGLAMMGFGFVVARFGLFLRELASIGHAVPVRHSGLSQWIGMALVGLGVGVNLFAAVNHDRFLRRLGRGEPDRAPLWSFGVVVTLLTAIIGIGMAVYLFAVGQ